jgi:hypothetical protein
MIERLTFSQREIDLLEQSFVNKTPIPREILERIKTVSDDVDYVVSSAFQDNVPTEIFESIGDTTTRSTWLTLFDLLKTAGDETVAKNVDGVTSTGAMSRDFFESVVDNILESVNLIDPKTRVAIRKLRGQKNRGEISDEQFRLEMGNIPGARNMVFINSGAKLALKVGGIVLVSTSSAIFGGATVLRTLGITNQNPDPKDINPELYGISASSVAEYMTEQEFNKFKTDMDLVLSLESTTREMVRLLPSLPESDEKNKLIQILNEWSNNVGYTSDNVINFNSRVINQFMNNNKKLIDDSNKDRIRSKTKDVIGLGYEGVLERINARTGEIAENLAPQISDFANHYWNDEQKTTIAKSIKIAMNNPLRRNINNYQNAMRSFFEEVGSQSNLAASWNVQSESLQNKLLGIDSKVIAGLDGNGGAFAANFMIKSVGVAMLLSLENKEITEETVATYYKENLYNDDVVENLMLNGYSAITSENYNLDTKYYGAYIPMKPEAAMNYSQILAQYPLVSQRLQSGQATAQDLKFALATAPISILSATQRFVDLTI